MLLRAVALGLASGARSTSAVTAVTLSGDAAPIAKRAAALALGGELVVDKLPATPSRLQPPSVALRLLAGAASAGFLARRREESIAVSAVIGLAAAGASTIIGARWRRFVHAQGRPDAPAALAEDIVTIALVTAAVAS